MDMFKPKKLDEKFATDIGKFLGTASQLSHKVSLIKPDLSKLYGAWEHDDERVLKQIALDKSRREIIKELLNIQELASELCGLFRNKTKAVVNGMKKL